MKFKILFIISWRHYLLFFLRLISELNAKEEFNLSFATEVEETVSDLKHYFPKCEFDIFNSYEPSIVSKIRPNLIICCEIWWWFKSLLKRARKEEIPILMYDHGSLLYTLFDDNEDTSSYRADVSLCTHIACWGERGRDCWAAYGASKDKMYLTGAMQYDDLYDRDRQKNNVYKQLDINPDKRIILIFTALHHPKKKWRQRSMSVTEEVQSFVNNNEEYQLVVKPHPHEIYNSDEPFFPYSQSTCIVDQFPTCKWKSVKQANINDIIMESFVVISYASSSIIAPIIMNIPIIHVELSSSSNAFSELGKGLFYNLKKQMSISSIIENVKFFYDDNRRKQSRKLAEMLNYKNDGKAVTRFIELIRRILCEQSDGKNFYNLSVDDELMANIRKYPNLPYSYQYLIKYFIEEDDQLNVGKWVEAYYEKFNDPSEFIYELSIYHFNRNMFKEVKWHFDKYLENFEMNEYGLFRLAKANKVLGYLDEALIHINRILSLDIKDDLKKKVLIEKKCIEKDISSFI